MSRRMNHRTPTTTLRKAIERPRKVRFWGNDYRITPRLVDEIFGDGKRLLTLTPISDRPNYYVVRIDSATDLNGYDFIDEILDAIYEVIEDQFGRRRYSEDEDEEINPFPAASFDSGCCWGEISWPEYPKKKARG